MFKNDLIQVAFVITVKQVYNHYEVDINTLKCLIAGGGSEFTGGLELFGKFN